MQRSKYSTCLEFRLQLRVKLFLYYKKMDLFYKCRVVYRFVRLQKWHCKFIFTLHWNIKFLIKFLQFFIIDFLLELIWTDVLNNFASFNNNLSSPCSWMICGTINQTPIECITGPGDGTQQGGVNWSTVLLTGVNRFITGIKRIHNRGKKGS